MTHVLIFYGTRPEAIKLAPIMRECKRRKLDTRVVHLEQHASARDYACEAGIVADRGVDLDTSCNMTDLLASVIKEAGIEIAAYEPRLVICQGDTLTAAGVAIAAFLMEQPLMHVEAGLRSNDLSSPFPEEFNRLVASKAATYHCAPSEDAMHNLISEGVHCSSIRVTGNTTVDACLKQREENIRKGFHVPGFMRGCYMLITAHRRENIPIGIARVCLAVNQLAEEYPRMQMVYLLHGNPKATASANQHLKYRERKNIIPLGAQNYRSMIWLIDNASVVITDSGGVQEEAAAMNKKTLVTRLATERREILGKNIILCGTSTDAIVENVKHLIWNNPSDSPTLPYGDGYASDYITDWIEEIVAGPLPQGRCAP